MLRGIDHVVIAVRNLAAASADYAAAGFTVTPGGEHTDGATHNALVAFADGSYFELIAFKEPDRPQEHKWWALVQHGEGTVDFALLTDDAGAEADRLRQVGIVADGPRDGGRQRPDGQRIAWRNLMPRDAAAPLPFVIEDVTPRDLRVPDGAAAVHPLGVERIAGVTLLVADRAAAAKPYEALLNATGTPAQSPIEGIRAALRFPLGQQWIELAEPEAAAADLHRHLHERGAGPYEVVLAGAEATAQVLLREGMHGARIRVEAMTPAST